MNLAILRGLGTVAFFALVIWAVIPVYVPRPNFIPGFAPPPDFWPRLVCWAGMALGLVSTIMAVLGQTPPVDPDEAVEATAPVRTLLLRFAAMVAALIGFTLLVDVLGFLLAAMLLTAAAIALTGERGRLAAAAICVLALPFGLDVFFGEALGTQFPAGALFR